MERGKYRFELGQIIKGENGEYVITKREKRKDYTKKAIQRKRYTLVCPNKHEFEMEESHIEYRTPKCPLCYHPKIIMADPNFAVMFVNKEYPYKYTCMSHKKADFYYLNEKLNSGFRPKGVRTKSWTKLLFLNYVYTEMDSFHPTIF